MAVVKGVFFDTSVLLGGLIELGPSSRAPQKVFDAVAAGRFERPATAWHCCLEFYAVATRLPEELRLTPADAWALLEGELLARFRISELPAGARKDFVRGVAQDGTRGGRLYDAHIAEIARRSGARVVLTENPRDFGSLLRDGVRVINAEEMLRQLRKR